MNELIWDDLIYISGFVSFELFSALAAPSMACIN